MRVYYIGIICVGVIMCIIPASVRLRATPLYGLTIRVVLENVEHCGGEPEQADTACLLAK